MKSLEKKLFKQKEQNMKIKSHKSQKSKGSLKKKNLIKLFICDI